MQSVCEGVNSFQVYFYSTKIIADFYLEMLNISEAENLYSNPII